MTSQMRTEALQAPEAAARQLAEAAPAFEALARSLRDAPPGNVLTLARGSSDHAAGYFAYLVMARLGLLVTSLPMSLMTLHDSRIGNPGLVALAFSQSGQSPDLVLPLRQFTARGARTVAVVNTEGSPLAAAADFVLPLCAGVEHSVAATKSCIAQLLAGAHLVARWQSDAELLRALEALPEALRRAAALDWGAAVDGLREAERLYVIGRGLGLPVALETALKFKETCGLHAEAFSGAEVQHGPMALVGPRFALLVLAPRGPAQPGLLEMAAQMQQRGAQVWVAVPEQTPLAVGLRRLPLATTAHEDLDAIAVAQSVYPMIEALARARGRDPDRPPHLAKVTRTH